MAVTLNATAVPAPVVPGTVNYMEDQYTVSGQPSTSIGQSSGNTAALASSIFNRNATGHDMLAVHGGGFYGIGSGLTLSAGTGLQCVVADGQALVHGLVELREGTGGTTAVVGASTTAWVWLMQNGTLTVQNGTTAKPTGNCCLLGAALTNGSAVTAVETGGVVYSRSGLAYRETNDAGIPGDSPDSTLRLFTKTQGGTYLWTGTAHRLVPGSTARAGTNASRTGVASGDLYLATDGGYIEHYNGTAWVQKWAPAVVKPDALANWTAAGATGVSAEAGGSLFLQATAAAGNAIASMVKAVPTGSWTIEMLVAGAFFNVATCRAGMVLRAADGKYYLFGWERPGALMIQRYNAYNTSTSTLFWESFDQWHPIGLKVSDNGTAVAFSMSADGYNYTSLISESRTAFMTTAGPTQYGFGVDAGNATRPAAIHVLSVKVS